MRSMTLHVWAIYSWSALSSQLITKALSRNFQMTVERTIPHGADMMRSDPMRSDPMVGDPLRGDPLHADGARRDLCDRLGDPTWRPDARRSEAWRPDARRSAKVRLLRHAARRGAHQQAYECRQERAHDTMCRVLKHRKQTNRKRSTRTMIMNAATITKPSKSTSSVHLSRCSSA